MIHPGTVDSCPRGSDSSTTYLQSQMYVTQLRPERRLQGAKWGANAGRR